MCITLITISLEWSSAAASGPHSEPGSGSPWELSDPTIWALSSPSCGSTRIQPNPYAPKGQTPSSEPQKRARQGRSERGRGEERRGGGGC